MTLMKVIEIYFYLDQLFNKLHILKSRAYNKKSFKSTKINQSVLSQYQWTSCQQLHMLLCIQVSLISADLKYTLSSLKIKTLQKAREYMIQQQLAIDQGILDVADSVGVVDKLDKIKKYLTKYDKVKQQVWAKINFLSNQRAQQQLVQHQNQSALQQTTICKQDDVIPGRVQQNTHTLREQNIISKCLSTPSITQITGQKGSGKTSLAIYCSQIFSALSNKKLYFINCSAGITYPRFQRLQQRCPHLEYRDSYQLQHVLKVCESAVKDQLTGCVVVDGLTNLLMEEEKTLVFLLKLFKIFTTLLNKHCQIIITNYVQQVFEQSENDDLTNHYTYYSSVTSQFIKYKLYLKQAQHKFQVKLIRGGSGEGEFLIGRDGIEQMKLNVSE